MSFVDRVHPQDVHSPEALAEYVRQTCGTPWATGKDMAVLKRQLKHTFAHDPKITYPVLVKTAQWARAKKKRPARVYSILPLVRWAWADGAIPELDPTGSRDEEVEQGIQDALERETNARWRRRLLGAEGEEARRAVLDEWRSEVLV